MYKLIRTGDSIDDLLNQCADAEEDGSKFPSMTYEQGVQATIRWLTDNSEAHPLED